VSRLIVDTSSYEEMLLSLSPDELGTLGSRHPYAVEGFVVIRKELRDIPRKRMLFLGNSGQAKMRLSLLSLYDYLTGGRSYALEEKMAITAEEYFAQYSAAGGGKNWEDMESDFEIVACASHKQVDLVVSDDAKTMLSEHAMHAYADVNKKLNLHTPRFISVEELSKTLRGVNLD
jgi:hypothetical protein